MNDDEARVMTVASGLAGTGLSTARLLDLLMVRHRVVSARHGIVELDLPRIAAGPSN